MSRKIKLTEELLERARIAFESRNAVYRNEGLTRGELRLLVRKGLITVKTSVTISRRCNAYLAEDKLWYPETLESIR
ncbi:unnamed protein product [marine sediment metagenome]|uniref:Uncharacterized protein n=1 Tax=marine sediment metagenome TaxID=412755 RepID=X0ZFN4_9ZZZZ